MPSNKIDNIHIILKFQKSMYIKKFLIDEHYHTKKLSITLNFCAKLISFMNIVIVVDNDLHVNNLLLEYSTELNIFDLN